MEDNKKDFVTSYFAWLSLSEQKKIVERLENITNENKEEKTYLNNLKNNEEL